MADLKISQLPAVIGSNLAADDLFVIVDTNNTATKSLSVSDLVGNIPSNTSVTGTLSVSATGVTLPAGSQAGTNKLAVVAVDSRGAEQAAQVVPFFTKAGGLSTANTNFSFNATIDEKFVFTGSKSFTLANGSSLSDSAITLFQF